jgi:DNA-3-methyladenine glycosylase II
LSQDFVLAPVIKEIRLDFKKEENPNVYTALIRSILGQQLSVKAAATIHQRFLTLFENGYPDKKTLLGIDIETLRGKGLSRQKASYIKNIATFFSEKEVLEIDWSILSNEEVIKKLTSIKGVGVWTVEMILMFSLNRSDVFPKGDLGIQNGMKQLYQLEKLEKKALLKKMDKIAEQWKPYRTFASRYIWAAKDKL